MKFDFRFISLGILLLTLYITGTESKVRDGYHEKETNISKHPVYLLDFRQIYIDARHVLEDVLSKGKVKVLGVDDWQW